MEDQLDLARVILEEGERKVFAQNLEDAQSAGHAHALPIQGIEVGVDLQCAVRAWKRGRKPATTRRLEPLELGEACRRDTVSTFNSSRGLVGHTALSLTARRIG
jgi:hypothetical protein